MVCRIRTIVLGASITCWHSERSVGQCDSGTPTSLRGLRRIAALPRLSPRLPNARQSRNGAARACEMASPGAGCADGWGGASPPRATADDAAGGGGSAAGLSTPGMTREPAPRQVVAALPGGGRNTSPRGPPLVTLESVGSVREEAPSGAVAVAVMGASSPPAAVAVAQGPRGAPVTVPQRAESGAGTTLWVPVAPGQSATRPTLPTCMAAAAHEYYDRNFGLIRREGATRTPLRLAPAPPKPCGAQGSTRRRASFQPSSGLRSMSDRSRGRSTS